MGSQLETSFQPVNKKNHTVYPHNHYARVLVVTASKGLSSFLHLEVASLVRGVWGPENGDVPHVHVRVVGNGHRETFHGLSVQRLQFHGERANGRGAGRGRGHGEDLDSGQGG